MYAGDAAGGSESAGDDRGKFASDEQALRRYFLTEGNMGYIPDWYPLVRAARYLGVAPWDLYERPLIWQTWALMADKAEIEGQPRPKEG